MRRFSVLTVTMALIIVLTPAAIDAHGGRGDRVLERYAADTWRSFDKLVDERTGLPADYIGGDLTPQQPCRLHVADQHRDVPLGDARRPRPRLHRQP